MSRKSILEVIKDIKKVLEKEGELSVKAISERIGSQWRTTIKALEFMEEMGLVRHRKGNETYKPERLFRIVK